MDKQSSTSLKALSPRPRIAAAPPWPTVEPSGKPFSLAQVHIFRVAGGLIAEHWAVRDDLGVAKQVGALPS